MNINITLPELYALIGEREVIKYKLGEDLKVKEQQIFEMSEIITKLREERDRLAEIVQEIEKAMDERNG